MIGFGTLRSLFSRSKDLTYEERVKAECDHDWSDYEPVTDAPEYPMLSPRHATIERGHIVVPVLSKHRRYCENCGEAGRAKGAIKHKVALPIVYEIDPDLNLSAALTEPVGDEIEYVSTVDGGAAPRFEDEDDSRIIVNRSENSDD